MKISQKKENIGSHKCLIENTKQRLTRKLTKNEKYENMKKSDTNKIK